MNTFTPHSSMFAAAQKNVLSPQFSAKVLRERFLQPMGIEGTDLALFVSVKPLVIEKILKKEVGITPELADRLSIRFGLSETFWSKLKIKDDANMPSFQELEQRLHQMVKFSASSAVKKYGKLSG